MVRLIIAIFYVSFTGLGQATPVENVTKGFNFPCKTCDAVDYAFSPVGYKSGGFYLPYQSEIGSFLAEDIFELDLRPNEELARKSCFRSIFTPTTPDGVHVTHQVIGYCGRSVVFKCVNLFPKSINHCTYQGKPAGRQYDHINVVTLTDNKTYECARRCWRNGITDFVCISTTHPKDFSAAVKAKIEKELARIGQKPIPIFNDKIFFNYDGCHFTDDFSAL